MTESTPTATSRADIVRMTTDLVAAYVGNNMLQAGQISDVINAVFGSLMHLEAAEPPAPTPAVSIRKSVTADYIVCLEDGKKMKMLKRHLRSTYNMTPDEYRARWGLPSDYPMVAPGYARQRSDFAKQIGLGRKPKAGKAKK